jgi:uncharacterized protein YkvS
MKKLLIKFSIIATIALGVFSSCVNDDSYGVPDKTLKTYYLTTTKTVAQVNAMAGSLPALYTEDDVIEAYVTSSDDSGTFYKSISFQDKIATAPVLVGFSVPINATTLFGKGFTPGRKIYIKLKGLYIAKVFGSLQIGSLYEGRIGRISEFEYQNYLFPSIETVNENALVRTLTLAQAFTDVNQNTLIDLSVVQFADSSVGRTYYDVDSGGGATNHLLSSSTSTTERIIRFSNFALFTTKQVPAGSGKIRGVLGKFASTYQFVVRYESDIKLTDARFDTNPAIVGNALVFDSTLNEPFTSYSTTNQTNFPKYINDAFVGSRYWQLKTFSGNKYIEMSAYNGANNPGVNAKVYFFVPVNLTAANTFTFKKQIRFNAGEALKIFYVTSDKYAPGDVIAINKFTDVTSSFNIVYPNNGSSDFGFTTAGTYQIPPAITGNGYFVFEYIGSATVTTTIQIDDIVIN